MALKLPGVTERIGLLWTRLSEGGSRPSQKQFAKLHGIDQQQFNAWLNGTQPDLDGLKALGVAFHVPWQWILVGDEGMAALVKHHQAGPSPEVAARAPTKAATRRASPGLRG